jgi:RHS repeat-associated protein
VYADVSASAARNTTTTTTTIDSTKSVQQLTATDGLGRAITSTTEDVSNTVYSIVAAKYDLFGRAYSTSNPYTGSSTTYWTTTQFDVLGRPISVTPPSPDASVTNFTYAEQYATFTDPAGKQRKTQVDGVGRLYKLFEPDISNNNSLNTQYTTYAYNVLDELTTATQGSQTRTFVYDAMGRLNTATAPESGTVCFGTYSGSTCQNGYDQFDNLQNRTDARGVVTSYSYDGLNRLNGVSYNVSGATGVPATSTVSLTYGLDSSCTTAHGPGCIGQLITMTDGVGSENYTYNALEQMAQLQKVIGATTYPTSYAYNLAGELTQITYPSTHVVQQSVDAIGRLCEIAPSTTGCGTAASPYATAYGYNAANQTTGFKYGNGLFASFGFSSDRLQLNCLDYSTTNRGQNCTHDSTSKFSLAYSYGAAGSNNGQISGITDNSGAQEAGRSVTYTYDPLYRLSIATTAGSSNYAAWGLKESYDRYGNRSAQAVNSGCTGITCPTNSLTPDPATNRITGDCYDANGNLLAQSAPPCPSPTYTYDAENRMVNYLTAAYTYDGNGLRVKKVSGSNTTVYIFSGSKVIAEYDNGALVGSPSREYIYSGSALLARIDSSGTKYYHQDHLSNRLVTDSSGNIFAQLGHFPFGEQWYNTASDKLIFTSYERDSESGNDYAMARYYLSPLGRFSSPDRLPGDVFDPQTLDRYAYTGDDPIDFVDPTGMFLAAPGTGCNLGPICDVGDGSPGPTLWVMYGWISISQEIWGQMFFIDFSSAAQPIGGDPGRGPGGGSPSDREKQFKDCLDKFGDKYATKNLTLEGFDAAGSAAAAGGIDQSAVLSLWENENKLSPQFSDEPGPAGEIGPIQVRPGVVDELSSAGILPANWDSNLEANLTAGALYYERMSSHYNIAETHAAAAYNAGPIAWKRSRKHRAGQGYQTAFNASQPGFRDLVNCMR